MEDPTTAATGRARTIAFLRKQSLAANGLALLVVVPSGRLLPIVHALTTHAGATLWRVRERAAPRWISAIAIASIQRRRAGLRPWQPSCYGCASVSAIRAVLAATRRPKDLTLLRLGGCVMVGLVGCGGAGGHTAASTPLSRPACPGPDARPVADPSAAADPELLQHLAILRRAPRAGDLAVRLKRRLFGSRNLAFNLDRIAVRGIRYLGRAPSGVSFYLVPATIRVPEFVCHPPQGPLTLALRARLRQSSEKALLRTHSFGLALAPVPPPGETAAANYSAGSLSGDVSANRVIAIFNQPTNRSATLAGVVPDGVSAVSVTYAGRVRTVRIAAGTNFWATVMPTLVPYHDAEPYRFAWLGRDGRVRERFTGIDESAY